MSMLHPIRDRVDGTAQVKRLWGHAQNSMWAPCEMELIVQAPGVEPFTLRKHFHKVRTNKWPVRGQVLPVSFDREHPDRLEVDWDRVPKRRDGAIAQISDFLRGGGENTTEVYGPDSPQAQQALGMVQQMLGGAMITPAPGPAAPAGDDLVAQLDRLGRLHERGALTDEEFAAQKAKLLGESS